MRFVDSVVCFCSLFFFVDLQWGIADAEIKVFSAENPERLNVLPLKPGEGKNIDMRTSPPARNYSLFGSYTTSRPVTIIFFQTSPQIFSLRQVWLRLISCHYTDQTAVMFLSVLVHELANERIVDDRLNSFIAV